MNTMLIMVSIWSLICALLGFSMPRSLRMRFLATVLLVAPLAITFFYYGTNKGTSVLESTSVITNNCP